MDDEYYKLIAFSNQNPDKRVYIPDIVFRRWRTNYHFLRNLDKLHLVTDLHIVLSNHSALALDLVEVFTQLSIESVPLTSIRSIIFVGPGIKYAGAVQNTSEWAATAGRDFVLIRSLYPNITMLGCLPDTCLEESPSHLLPTRTPGIQLLAMLTEYYLGHLTTVQATFTFPTTTGLHFCENLTTLSIHHRFVRTLAAFPQVPVEQLHTLNVLKIDKFIAWEMFVNAKRRVCFPKVENLGFEFLKPDGKQRPPTGYDYTVSFPAVKLVKIKGLAYSSVNFPILFPGFSVNVLHLADSPYRISPTEMRTFRCAINLEIASPEGHPERPYEMDGFNRLFRTRTSVMGLTVKGPGFLVPTVINWGDLQGLYFKAGIADRQTLANLIRQLKQLKTLVILCYSMLRADGDVDKAAAVCNIKREQVWANLSKVDEMMASDNITAPLSASLIRLDISARSYFDWFAVLQLLGRLPMVTSVGVNEEFVAKIDAWFKTLFQGRALTVRKFSDDSKLG
ncbi:hypothetical protein EC988_001872 [Linderina pennispora]|nr:hypothetical protein EC988_001872 [Linderina pennispora]